MRYDEQRIAAIERTWLTPNWIPQKDFTFKASEDVHYLLSVITELKFMVAQTENRMGFRPHPGD